MDGNGFDGFDSFGADSFGSDAGFSNSSMNDGFDGFGNDSFDTGFNTGFDNASTGGFSSTNSSVETQNQFDGAFDSNNDFQDVPDGDLKKKALILVVVGVILLILVVLGGSVLTKALKNNDKQVQVEYYQQDNTVGSGNNAVSQYANQNVDALMQSSYNQQPQVSQQPTQTVITNTKDDNFTWSDITANEQVTFNENYVDMTFTVTGIQHKARAVDTNGNLVVKTKLLGSISGLSGTYEIDVPYNKGVKLVVGNSFTVHVQLGSFNDKTVVGEILY